ncbi:hypothetical protein BKI52_38265 [marine bacterium AO1-C]|nr:hypothetical protein BKI52_38265 [marine bacterium AO1-C]
METNLSDLTNSKKTGKLAGLLYLIIAPLGFFSIGYVPSVIVGKTAIQTMLNLQANQTLFLTGVTLDILICFIELLLTTLLFQIFRSVNKTQAMVAAVARFTMIFIMAINLLVYLTPILMLKNAMMQKMFTSEETAAIIQLLFDVHEYGILMWGFFFGLHLVLMGVLVIRSVKHPTWVGYLLLAGSFGYILEAFNKICFGNQTVVGYVAMGLLAIVVVGELSFAIWLLIKGVKTEQTSNQQPLVMS